MPTPSRRSATARPATSARNRTSWRSRSSVTTSFADRPGGGLLLEPPRGGARFPSPTTGDRRARSWTRKALAFAAALLAPSAALAAPPCGAAGAAIERASRLWQEAYAAGDAAGLAALYAEGGRIYPPDEQIIEGRPGIAAFFQRLMDAGIAEIRVKGGPIESSGILAHRSVRFSVVTADGAVVGEGKAVEVWRCGDGEWLFLRDIWNSTRPAPARDADDPAAAPAR